MIKRLVKKVDGMRFVGWITGESLMRLQHGGNGSRGTVPIHPRSSSTAKTALYMLKTK